MGAAVGLEVGPMDAGQLNAHPVPPSTIEEEGAALAKAAQALGEQNTAVTRAANAVTAEVGDIAVAQCIKSEVVASGLWQTFSPQVLADLKSNADQLLELKQQCLTDKQAAKENSKKMMAWMSGSIAGAACDQPPPAATAGQLVPSSDAVKQRRFLPFQLGGSSIAGKAAPAPPGASPSKHQALKFWQVGIRSSRPWSGRRNAADAPASADQQQQQQLAQQQQAGKGGISGLLAFGRSKRASDSGSRRASIDAATSWRSSHDGSSGGGGGRRSSGWSSDGGGSGGGAAALRTSTNAGAAQQQAGATADAERGAMLTSLAAGEGPLSRRHSQLATKPGLQQEHLVGKSLECVAEDEREGRDSPAPGEPPGAALRLRSGQMGLAPIRVPRSSHSLGAARHPGSPVESFSFGNRPDEEQQPHSPSFLRASVSSRASQQPGAAGAVAGPLLRSSAALRASMVVRQDPFEAPEPEPQPFVEQLRAEGQQDAAAAGGGTGLVAALRRSISSGNGGRGAAAAAAAARWEGGEAGGSRRTPRTSMDAGAAPQQQQQQGQDVAFLDLDATRAYALGVHSVMMGLERTVLSTTQTASQASSNPTSPRSQQAAAEAAAAAAAAAGAGAAGVSVSEEQAEHACPPRAQQQQQQHPAGSQQLQQERSEPGPPPLQVQDSSSRMGGRGGAARQDQLPSPAAAPAAAAPGGPMPRAEASEAGGMPPLQSGLASPASSRRQTLGGGGPAAAAAAAAPSARPLPVMGQACMELLDRPPQSLQASRQQPLSTSTSVSLADVYRQTSGNLAPLSSGLSGMVRRPSSSGNSSRQPPGSPQQGGLLPRSLSSLHSGASVLAGAPAGPLSLQHGSSGSSMPGKRLQQHAPGLVPPSSPARETHRAASGWLQHQGSLTSPAGPMTAAAAAGEAGMPPAESAFAPAAANNKYASSWGLLDAGGLSRQNSLSRAASGATPPSQRGTPRGTPRASLTGGEQLPLGGDHMPPAGQQQQRGGAVRRYPASITPGSQSPRSSGAVTPGRDDVAGLGGPAAGGDSGGGARHRGARGAGTGAGPARGGRQQQGGARAAAAAAQAAAERHSNLGSEDSANFASADEQLSSGASGLSGGLSGPTLSANGGAGSGQQGLPVPPAFLSSGRPTSAQAAVATQWSPNRGAAAMAQAPAYAREAGAVVMDHASLAAEASSGLGDPHASSGSGNPYYYAAARSAFAGQGVAAATHTAPAGGHNIYAPLDPAVPRAARQQYQQPYQQQQPYLQQQQQQHVVTAVDLARRQSLMRRASGAGGRTSDNDGYGGSISGYNSSGADHYHEAPAYRSAPTSRNGSLPGPMTASRQHSAARQQYGMYERR